MGRFLGAFAVAALCMLAVPLAALLGSVMPWAHPATIGPDRLSHHLYGYFLIALPNLFIHSALFFALATITRSMMARTSASSASSRGSSCCRMRSATGRSSRRPSRSPSPSAGRALSDAMRYWTVAERNVMLPDLTGTLLYNRFLWIGVAGLCLAFAYAVYRFADQGMSRRERKRLKLAQPPSAEAGAPWKPLPCRLRNTAARAARPALDAHALRGPAGRPEPGLRRPDGVGLYSTFFVLLTQRDPDGRPTYPTTLTLIPQIEDASG